jgi:hypothetical protein
MDKKAFTPQEVIIFLIIFMVGAGILFSFSNRAGRALIEDGNIEACRLSVLAQAQTKTLGKPLISLDCPRRNIEFFDNKIYLNEKKYSDYRFKELGSDTVNKAVAEELRKCWYMMAEGKRNIFENEWFGIDNTCIVCSEIEFNDELKGSRYSGLVNYLNSNKIPNGEITYNDYLIRSQSNIYTLGIPWTQFLERGYGTTLSGKINNVFDANDKYSIYFLAYKPTQLAEYANSVTSAYYIGIGDESKVSEECTSLLN